MNGSVIEYFHDPHHRHHRGVRGIGSAVARRLAVPGAHLVLVGRSPDRLAATAAVVADAGAQPHYVIVDLRDPDAVDVLRTAVPDADALVCCAGGGGRARPAADLGVDDWSQALRTNLDTAVTAVTALLPGMIRRHTGRWCFSVPTPVTPVPTRPRRTPPRRPRSPHLPTISRHGPREDGVRVNVVAPGTVPHTTDRRARSRHPRRPRRDAPIAASVPPTRSHHSSRSCCHPTRLDHR